MNKIIEEDAILIAESNIIDWNLLHNKTIVIVGANGYVTQYFIHALLKRNDIYNANINLIALCRNKEKAIERFSNYQNRDDFKIIYDDICAINSFGQKVDYIIHAASPAGIKVTMSNPLAVFNANVLGMDNIAKIALNNNCRVMFVSSVDVYGHILEDKRYDETDIGCIDHLSMRNIYASAKRAAESLCMCYAQKGLDFVIIRPSQIMGAGIALDDERLHINMISQMLSKGKITLKGDGTPKRSFIYITDAIIGALTVLTKGKSSNVYNVCNENNEATVRELAEIISYIISSKKDMINYDEKARKNDPAVKSVVSKVCISSEKLNSLGWYPTVSIETSAKKMIKYYKDDGEKNER